MKHRIVSLVAVCCVLFAGCSWMDGSYFNVQPHEDHSQLTATPEASATNYAQLLDALHDMIVLGKEKGVIYVSDMEQSVVTELVAAAVRRTLNETPLGAYAVESMHCEVGTSNGKPAVAVEIGYLHGRSEIRNIRHVADMATAVDLVRETLKNCDASLVLQVENYEQMDLEQLAQDYAMEYPQTVMEVPQVTVGTYPENGTERILEIKFTYQNSRDVLRQMQTQVSEMFEAAALYVGEDSTDNVKLSRLYGFIAGLGYVFQYDTSITPAYSLLRHGVGDSKAFATVYAAMCRQVGLDCRIVTGTYNAEVRYWNIACDGDRYTHIDLLRCAESGHFVQYSDAQMTGYVWDYSAYPACDAPPVSAQEHTEQSTEPAENIPDATQTDELLR